MNSATLPKMPVATISSLPIYFFLVVLLPTALIVENPSRADAYTLMGALLASFLAIAEARIKDRSFTHLTQVFIASVLVGATFPGLSHDFMLWRGWMPDSLTGFLSWKVWLVSGFFFGVNGWMTVHFVRRVIRKRAEKMFRRYMDDAESDTDRKTKEKFSKPVEPIRQSTTPEDE